MKLLRPGPGFDQADIYALDSYVPHVVGGIGWTGGWGGVSVVAGYDAVFEEGAIKGRVDFNVNDAISLFVMAGYGTHDDEFWQRVWCRYSTTARTTTLLGAASGLPGLAAPGSSPSRRPSTSKSAMMISRTFSVAANVDYELVPNLHIIPEVVYFDGGNDFFFDRVTDTILDRGRGDDEWGGFLRVQYNWGG